MRPLSEARQGIKKTKAVFFDFDGVFTDNTVLVDSNGVESVTCWRSDGLGLSKLKNIGFAHWIISTETNNVVSLRAQKLKIECVQGVENKLVTLSELISEMKLDFSEVIYVGNDINDLDCLESVGVPVIVADAHADVNNPKFYRTKAAGGYGAVREVCDFIYSIYSQSEVRNEQ